MSHHHRGYNALKLSCWTTCVAGHPALHTQPVPRKYLYKITLNNKDWVTRACRHRETVGLFGTEVHSFYIESHTAYSLTMIMRKTLSMHLVSGVWVTDISRFGDWLSAFFWCSTHSTEVTSEWNANPRILKCRASMCYRGGGFTCTRLWLLHYTTNMIDSLQERMFWSGSISFVSIHSLWCFIWYKIKVSALENSHMQMGEGFA